MCGVSVVLPDALETKCVKCSPKQKEATEKVFKHLREHRQAEWQQLQNKYDPRGEYRRRYEAEAKERGYIL